MSLFEVDNAPWNNDFGIAENLVFWSVVFLMGNVLEFLSLISSEHLVLDRVSYALLASCTIFRVKILLFLYLLLLL